MPTFRYKTVLLNTELNPADGRRKSKARHTCPAAASMKQAVRAPPQYAPAPLTVTFDLLTLKVVS